MACWRVETHGFLRVTLTFEKGSTQLSTRFRWTSTPYPRDTILAFGLIVACLVAEAAVLRMGIDDLDEGYFVQQAARVLHGQIPYRDFETLYAPGLAYVHAALFGLVGGPFLLSPRVLALAARAALALQLF